MYTSVLKGALLAVIASLYMSSAHAQSAESGSLAESFAYHWPMLTDPQMSAVAIGQQLKNASASSGSTLLAMPGNGSGLGSDSDCGNNPICVINNTSNTVNSTIIGDSNVASPLQTATPSQSANVGTLNSLSNSLDNGAILNGGINSN